MTGRAIAVIVVLLVIIVAAWYLLAGPAPSAPSTTTTGTSTPSGPTGATSINPQSQNVTVTMTAQGFSPASVTIPQGATVTFVNQSSESMWVASDPHPAHTGYDGTSRTTHCAAGYTGPAPFDECAAVPTNGSYSFTFNKVGTWGYHNHADHALTGTVVVTALVQNGGMGPGATSTPTTTGY